MIRQVDWAWIAMGAVDVRPELARPAALRTDRVDRIKPMRTSAAAPARDTARAPLLVERAATSGA